MTNIIRIRTITMPMVFRAFTKVDKDGAYNVYINDRLSAEAMAKAFEHEKRHIENGDFLREDPASIFDK